MICPGCGAKTRTVRTRNWDNGVLYRRRECLQCSFLFTTYETCDRPKRNANKRPSIEKFLDVALKRY